MWLSFLVAVFAALLILVVPGFAPLYAFGFDGITSLCISPSIAVALISILCICFGETGIHADWMTVLIPLCLLAAALLFVKSWREKAGRFRKMSQWHSYDPKCLATYLVFAVVVAGWFFVRTLDGPSSFSQEHDNIHHLLQIREFLVTGQMSSLHESVYLPSVLHGYSTPSVFGRGFYPSGWHEVAALVADLSGGDVALAQNAVIFVFLAIVYPLSGFLFLSHIFNENRAPLYAGAFLLPAFSAFPWQFLIFGTLYPNFGGYSLVPIAVTAFMGMSELEERRSRLGFLTVFLVSSFAMANMHPNSVFTASILLFPYCLQRVYLVSRNKALRDGKGVSAVVLPTALFVLLFVGVWLALYRAPFFRNIVSFYWAPFASIRGQFLNVLTLAFKAEQAQELLGAIVLIGLSVCLASESYLWIVLAYVLCFVICFVNGITDNEFRNVLSGFWYNDQFRVGGMMAIVCLPLACLGASAIGGFYWRVRTALGYEAVGSRRLYFKKSIPYALLAAALFVPSFQLAGRQWHHTAFGRIEDSLLSVNSMTSIMSPEEDAFMEEVSHIVGDDDLILNQPHDGSVFGTIRHGLNLYYLTTSTPSPEGESFESRMIRTGLNLYGRSPLVHDAVEKLGADYLLLLDVDGKREGNRYWYGHYFEKDWVGINAVGDDTPGFEVVLSRGDMRLYRIVR